MRNVNAMNIIYSLDKKRYLIPIFAAIYKNVIIILNINTSCMRKTYLLLTLLLLCVWEYPCTCSGDDGEYEW